MKIMSFRQGETGKDTGGVRLPNAKVLRRRYVQCVRERLILPRYPSMVTAAINPSRLEATEALDSGLKPLAVFGGPKMALIIPTLREAANIPVLLARVRAVLDPTGIDYEILIVD